MSAPVTPDGLRELLPKRTDDLCEIIEKAGAFDTEVVRLLEWMFDECGRVRSTDDSIKGDICGVQCTTTTTTTSTSTSSTTSTTSTSTSTSTTTTTTSTTSTTSTTTTEPEGLVIPASGTEGTAFPYPSSRVVSGMVGNITKVVVNFIDLTHTYPDDLRFLLVSPTGKKVVLMQDCGGDHTTPITNVDITFDDAAASSLPDASQIVTGTYKPTQYGVVVSFPSPAPGTPYQTTLAAFNGDSPNGTWLLYAWDDEFLQVGSLANWSLNITVA